MNQSEISPETSTNNATSMTTATVTSTTTPPPTVTSNQKNEEDARRSLRKLAACHRQFYRRLSHVTTNPTTTVNDSSKMITASAACTDNDESFASRETSTSSEATVTTTSTAQESAERDPPSRELNERSTSSSSSSSSLSSSSLSSSAELNDSGRAAMALSNNLMRVLNGPADVSDRRTEAESPPVAASSFQGCRYPKGDPAAVNLIGDAIDVSSSRANLPTPTTRTVSFGSSSGGSTDVSGDKRNEKTSTTTPTPTTTTKTTTTVYRQLPPEQVNSENKWTGIEEPNVSCHSTFGASTSCETETGTLTPAVRHLSQPTVTRQSLVEQRKRDLFERSQEDTRARSRSRSPIAEDLQRDAANFPSVDRLVKMYTKLLQDNGSKQPAAKDGVTLVKDLEKMSIKEDVDQLKLSAGVGDLHRNSPLSDEGCTLGQSPYSSDCEDDADNDADSVKPSKKKKEKVARSASSDSALGLDDEPMEPPVNLNQGRRMTLTVTDLPLRPALLPLAEPTDLPDSPTAEVQISLNALLTQTAVPSKVLLEERVVEIPDDRFGSLSSSRRESAQSCISDYQTSECGGVRFVRTPSVVVSDYSDDLMCGITLEEIEYFRAQRLRRRSSVETSGTEKDDAASDVSAASSCSNLYYCGSTISALDGAECYVNGIRMPIDRKISDCSTCDGSGDEDTQSFVIPEQPEDLKDYISYCTEQMVAQQQQQQQNRKPKKVGGDTVIDTCNTNTSGCDV